MAVIVIDNGKEGGGRLFGRLRRHLASVAAAARHLQTRTTARPGPPPDPTEPEVLRASGDLSDWRAVRELNRRCEAHLRVGRGRVVIDLSGVERADSKLVASLVLLARRARSVRVAFEIRPSSQVSNWIALCRVDQDRTVSTT
jgi:ABC-type transporter Mla MlaB component